MSKNRIEVIRQQSYKPLADMVRGVAGIGTELAKSIAKGLWDIHFGSKLGLQGKRKDITSISDYFNLIYERLNYCAPYLKVPNELSKRLKVVKGMLDTAKRELAHLMKENRLTVPIDNTDPRKAMMEGY